MPSVLIVEDSQLVLKILRHIAAKTLHFDVEFATSRQQALKVMKSRQDWLAAIVDLSLPDAPNGELVDDVLEHGIPAIVLTGSLNDQKRDHLTKCGIVDYVLKEGRYSYQYAVNMVNRLYRNQTTKVLVAEDSTVTRRFIGELLSRHLFQVVEADNGKSALDAILADDEIKILLTDYNMPTMDGFELIHELRHRHERTNLFIIGLSSVGDKYLSAKFIKNGANDFLYKPFSHEEFFCRIMQGVDATERLDTMRAIAYTDSLTGLPNRRAFVERGRVMLRQANDQGGPISIAILDIDRFKQINDQFGHEAGDEVLIHFANTMSEALDRFLFARTSGEEFVVLMPGLSEEKALQLLNVLRLQIETESVFTDAGTVEYTFSGGIAQGPAETLEALMKMADELLYRAKEAGRNMLLIS
ncbi:MAG: diguanylate cyclase [Reinekea sp.]